MRAHRDRIPGPKRSFDPPQPETPSALETAGMIGGGVVLLALAAVIGPLPDFGGGLLPDPPFDDEARARALRACGADQARAPQRDPHGSAQCTGCAAFVPYASMSLNEDGYFCASCAA